MRIALVNYVHAPQLTTPESLIASYETLRGVAGALSREVGRDGQVRVFQGFTSSAIDDRGAAVWEFVRCPHSSSAKGLTLRQAVNERVAAWMPDVVHLNGLLFAYAAADLRRHLPRWAALLLQHHAEPPPRSRLKRWVFRAALAGVDGFSFSGLGLCDEWRAAGLIRERQLVFEIMEGSTAFRPGDREEARRRSGLDGEPCLLWVGRFDRNKDPITVLAGFEKVVKGRPGARLHMVYADDTLGGAVQSFIAQRPGLESRVTLLGHRPHDWLEHAFRAADVFVSGSHREGSGYAATEAIACGAVPVLTDIESFRFLTGGAAFGALWKPGEAEDLVRALSEVLSQSLASHRERGRVHFDAKLSFAAIARDAIRAYSHCTRHRESSLRTARRA